MKPSALAAAIERGRVPEDAVADKLHLFDRCDALRSRLGWHGPEDAWWIPGRLEVFGKHTDYAGGHTLVAALPRGFAVVATRASSPGVTVADAMSGEIVSVDAGSSDRQPRWAPYVDAVIRRLARNFPGFTPSAKVAFASDLPPAAGMSSSSALMVGIAAALIALEDLESRDEWQRNVIGPLDAAAYFACIENGATFRDLAGDAGVGTHGGSEDHAAILCATPAELTAFAFVPLRLVARTSMPPDWRFVIATSGVRAEKTRDARQAYNALSLDATAILELWNSQEPPASSLAEALAGSPSAVSRLTELLGRSAAAGSRREGLMRRLEHFVREDRRVLEALAAFSTADGPALATLASESQRDAESLLRNQVPETVELVAAAQRCGAIAASAFGAGFGGSVWAVIEREAASDFAGRWLADCRPACAPGAAAFTASPGPAMFRLTSS